MMYRRILTVLLFSIFSFVTKAQLVVNEFSQGNSGVREYMELVVKGTRTCTDSTADLRGWVVDDQNGWYGGTGTGIATGSMRFSNNTNWQAVPYGSIILVYNDADANVFLPADDPTDANNDYLYVVPINSASVYFESNTTPSAPSSPTFVYPTTGYTNANNNWGTRLGLANGGDAVITVAPSNLGVAYHSVVFGFTPGAGFQTPSVLLPSMNTGGKNAYLTDNQYNVAASWAVGNATAALPTDETPGVANTIANATWINSMRAPATAPVISSATGANPTTCSGTNGSITLNGLGATITYTVSYSKNAAPATTISLTSNAGGQVVIPNLTAGVYTTITVTGACGTSLPAGPVTLSNPPAPTTPTPGSNSPVCAGAPINLTTAAVAGATYSWTGPNSFTSAVQNPTIANAALVNAGVYSLTITVAGCTSAAGTTTVVVNPLPGTPTAGNNGPLCAGATINLTASTILGATYSWTGPNSFTSSTQNPSLTATAAAAGIYSVTASLAGCTSTAGTTTVVVNPIPATPTAGSNSPVCAGNPINLTTPTVAGATYAWTGPNSFTAATQNPSIASATAAAAGTYSVTVTTNGCTSAAGTTTVVVNPIPAAPTAGSNSPVCVGATINLTAATVAGATYNWTGPNSFTAATQNPSVLNATAAAAGTYAVTVTVAGCTSAAGNTTVVINPIPAAPTAGSNSPVCVGNAINLTASTVAGATYAWTGPNSFVSSSQNPTLTAIATSGGAYIVRATVAGCVSLPATATVVVTPLPVISSSSSTNPTVCTGTNGSITLNGLTASTTYTVSYSRNGVPVSASVTANASGTVIITGLTAGAYTNIIVTNGGCNSLPVGPFTLTDPAAPAAPVAGSNSPICAGANLNLTASTVTGATYNWTGPNSFTSTTQSPTITGASALAAGTYNVTATVGGCVSAPGTVTVVIKPIPATPTASSNGPICTTDTLRLTSSSTTSGVTYSWTGPNAFTSATQNPTIPNPVVAASGNYIVTVSLNGCTSAAATVAVVVKPTPAAPVVTSNSPVCTGSVLNLNATSSTSGVTYSWTGPNSFTAATQNPSITGVTAAAAGTYIATATLAGCTATGNTTVVVNPSPVITNATGTNPTTCGGTNGFITITGLLANTSYTLTIYKNTVLLTNTLVLTSDASGNIIYNGLNAASYSNISVSRLGCASNVVGPVVLVDPNAPASSTAGSNSPVCSGLTLNLTGTTVPGGVTYNWTGPNGFTATTQSPSIPAVTTAANGIYTLIVSLGGCNSVPSTTNVTITQSPAIPAVTSNTPVCVGNTILLTATGTAGATYGWTGPAGFTSSTQNPSITNATVAMTGTYTATATIGTCISAPGSTTVTVVPTPAPPTVTTPVTYCQNATASPLTATGSNLLFYISATGGTGVPTVTPVTTTAGSTNYYVSQSTSGCESGRTLLVVTVLPKPSIPASTLNYSFCQFSTASALAATGVNLQWYATPTGGTGSATAPVPNTTVAGTFHYYVSQTVNGCESDRAILTVVINTKPAPPTVQSPVYYCQYESVPLTAQGQNLLWYTSPTGGAGQPVILANTNNEDSFFYYVTQTVNGCESDRARIRVFINYKPNGIILGSRPWTCQGDTLSFQYFGNATPGAVYNWKIPMPQSQYVSGSGQGPYVVRFDTAGNQYINLMVNNKGCLSDLIQLPVEVRPAPILTFEAKPDACVDEVVNVALSGVTSGISNYAWTFDGGNIIYSAASGGPYGIKWTTAGKKTVSVIATSNQCGSRAFLKVVDVHPLPDARIQVLGNSSSLCAGDSLLLQANNTDSFTKFIWTPDYFFTTGNTFEAWALVKASGYVRLTATSMYGCIASDSVLLATKPCCSVFFPNAFSPNGDGRNDVFRPITSGHHQISNFRIINRWGQVVYESRDELKGWDGTFNGKAQDANSFYYYLKYKCTDGQELEEKGEFILMR